MERYCPLGIARFVPAKVQTWNRLGTGKIVGLELLHVILFTLRISRVFEIDKELAKQFF